MDEYRMVRRVLMAEVSEGRVRLNAGCEGGLGQQRNYGGDSTTMLKR